MYDIITWIPFRHLILRTKSGFLLLSHIESINKHLLNTHLMFVVPSTGYHNPVVFLCLVHSILQVLDQMLTPLETPDHSKMTSSHYPQSLKLLFSASLYICNVLVCKERILWALSTILFATPNITPDTWYTLNNYLLNE